MEARKKVTFKILRFDPDEGAEAYFDRYEVPVREGQTVLEGIFYILDQLDGSIAFRYSCRGAVCGSCAMYINGAYRLACGTQIASLNSDVVSIAPLPNMPVIKDLVVDMSQFFENYEKVRPYLISKTPPPKKEWRQSPEQRKEFDEMTNCILCASCYSACPMVWTDKRYIGPAALTKAYRFVADSRDEGTKERLAIVADEHGVWRCHTIFNCAEACPKKINGTYSIQQLKKRAMLAKLKFW